MDGWSAIAGFLLLLGTTMQAGTSVGLIIVDSQQDRLKETHIYTAISWLALYIAAVIYFGLATGAVVIALISSAISQSVVAFLVMRAERETR